MIGRISTSGVHCDARAITTHRFGPVGRITASFGVTVLTTKGDFGSLVKWADVALYKAKTAGRNRAASL
jgi:PleD family two-component response regulator